jgi:ribosomal protein S18 acetylase RimI-like enzyme
MDALDNPVYSALHSGHASFALTHGSACRYPAAVAPFAGLRQNTPAGFADLSTLVAPGEHVALLSTAPLAVPEGWSVTNARWIDQMVLESPHPVVAAPEPVVLGEADVPAMLALTAATQPGPFVERTFELGLYLGIRDGDRLVAMAGERMRPQGAVEISAVCTDPEYLGRGHAKALMTMLADRIVAAGQQPMLHVKTENGAKRLYERLGFRVRREMRLTIVTRPR